MAVFGPAPAPLAMLRGRHRFRLLVHAARAVPVQDIIRDWLGGLSWKSERARQRRRRSLFFSLSFRWLEARAQLIRGIDTVRRLVMASRCLCLLL